MDRVSLYEIYTFCNGTPTTRNMVEGENVLNSGHLIHCGYTNKDDANTNLFAMCFQKLREKPHEVYGSLSFQNCTTWIVSQMVCFCKAGASQTCKHIVATLLYINRSGINILEEVSQTDLKCTWNQQKPALQLYAPKSLKNHSYFNKSKIPNTIAPSGEILLKIQHILLNKNKKSAIAIHSSGRYTPCNDNEQTQISEAISRDKCQLQIWAYLCDFRVYTTNKKPTGAPTDHSLCLVDASGLKQYIACTSKKSLSYWMCAMRLSKYGKQLRDNYRSFVKKHNDANDYEYNKKPLPNESIRSHVAMDFSGNVGRIVEDPKEALAIAQAETGSVRRSWRSSSRTTPGLQAAVSKLENDIHLSQPWYHKNISRDQAAHVLNRLGHKDGVFLIRESKSKCGSYVLSFKCGGKIVHTPIVTQMDPVNDQVWFSLDHGVTKFYDLLQLVEFYQLNAGSLPTRLMHYVVQVPK